MNDSFMTSGEVNDSFMTRRQPRTGAIAGEAARPGQTPGDRGGVNGPQLNAGSHGPGAALHSSPAS